MKTPAQQREIAKQTYTSLSIWSKAIVLILVGILTPLLLLAYIAFFCISAILTIVSALVLLIMILGDALIRMTITAVKLTNKLLLFRRTNKL